jgi:hypothetical protein
MPKPKFSSPKPNYCVDCRADISHLTYNSKLCIACAKARRVERGKGNHHPKRPKPLYRVNKTAPGLDYYCQTQTADGKSYIINFRGKWLRIAKVCHYCKCTDELVKGQWAPIYSITDVRGNEIYPVLLCLDCYKLECRTQPKAKAS